MCYCHNWVATRGKHSRISNKANRITQCSFIWIFFVQGSQTYFHRMIFYVHLKSMYYDKNGNLSKCFWDKTLFSTAPDTLNKRQRFVNPTKKWFQEKLEYDSNVYFSLLSLKCYNRIVDVPYHRAGRTRSFDLSIKKIYNGCLWEMFLVMP